MGDFGRQRSIIKSHPTCWYAGYAGEAPHIGIHLDSGIPHEGASPLQIIMVCTIGTFGCQPYLCQATMSELLNILNNDNNRKTATQKDVENAIDRAIIATSPAYFINIWKNDIHDDEREFIKKLAFEKSLDFSAQYKRLIQKEILREDDGKLCFCVPVFGEWILKNV